MRAQLVEGEKFLAAGRAADAAICFQHGLSESMSKHGARVSGAVRGRLVSRLKQANLLVEAHSAVPGSMTPPFQSRCGIYSGEYVSIAKATICP